MVIIDILVEKAKMVVLVAAGRIVIFQRQIIMEGSQIKIHIQGGHRWVIPVEKAKMDWFQQDMEEVVVAVPEVLGQMRALMREEAGE